MNPRQHLTLLLQAVATWLAFWLAGLPDYYQQYSTVVIGFGCVLISVAISLYFTLPFAVLDTAYCGVYLGHGSAYLGRFWYLTIFYLTPWLTFPPTAWLLGDATIVQFRR